MAGEVAAAAVLRFLVLVRPIAALDRVFIPDDTYYTLSIARSLAHGHGPTTDSHTLTSGFQPLLAFLMVPVVWVTNNPDIVVRAAVALLLACDVAIVVLVAAIAWRLAGPVAAVIAAGVWGLSPTAIRVAAGGLETTLAIACQLGLVLAWMLARERNTTRSWIVVGALAGLAVLARIDSLALVAALVVVHAWRGPRRSLAIVGGAAGVVLAPWWGYCIVTFGSVVPQSGAAERTIGEATAHSTALAAGSFMALVGPFSTWDHTAATVGAHHAVWPTLILGGVLIGAGVYAAIRGRARADDWAIFVALPAFGAVLVAFYAWFALSWYTYRYVAPVAAVMTVTLAIAIASILRWCATRKRSLRIGIAVVLAAAVSPGLVRAVRLDARTLTARDARFAGFSPFVPITGYRAAAQAANGHTPDGAVIGASQSGALGYFATGHRVVINLDGVVNHDAYEASRRHQLGAYIERRRIHWLVDNPGFVLGLALEVHRLDPTARSLGPVVHIRPIDAPALDVAHLGYASRPSIHS